MNSFMVEAQRVGEYGGQTMYGLTSMSAMLAVCYDTYGAKTKSPYSAYGEVMDANEHGIRIIPLKLCNMWPPAPRDSDGKDLGAHSRTSLSSSPRSSTWRVKVCLRPRRPR